jgi:anti-sigma B factor antagonist
MSVMARSTNVSPKPTLQVQDSVCAGRHTLAVSGELDLSNVHELDVVVRQLCANGTTIALDLSKLDFMDSAGLKFLLSASEATCARGCAFSVVVGSGQVRRVMEVCGLLDMPFVRYEGSSEGTSPASLAI